MREASDTPRHIATSPSKAPLTTQVFEAPYGKDDSVEKHRKS
ncbi:hypothetical protein [Aurantivibrio plasticivorans]